MRENPTPSTSTRTMRPRSYRSGVFFSSVGIRPHIERESDAPRRSDTTEGIHTFLSGT